MIDKDLLIRIRNGLKSSSLNTKKMTLKEISEINPSDIENPNILNILSDMIDYFIEIEQTKELKEKAIWIFMELLPFTFGYRVHQSIKENTYSSIGKLIRLYFNLYQESDQSIIKPSSLSVNYLINSIPSFIITKQNKLTLDLFFQISWRFALQYPDNDVQKLFALISKVILRTIDIFDFDELNKYSKKIRAVKDYYGSSHIKDFDQILATYDANNRDYLDLVQIQETRHEVSTTRIKEEESDIVIYEEEFKECEKLYNQGSSEPHIVEKLLNLNSSLSLARMNIIPSLIPMYDDLVSKILDLLHSIKPKTDDNTNSLSHIKILDRMSKDRSLFDI